MRRMHNCFLFHEYPLSKHGGLGSFTRTLRQAFGWKGTRCYEVGLYPISSAIQEEDAG